MAGKEKSYLWRTPNSVDYWGRLRVATSSCEGEASDAFRGGDTARFLKSMLRGVSIWEWESRYRNDNPGFVEHVHSINSVTKGRRLNGFYGVIEKSRKLIPGWP